MQTEGLTVLSNMVAISPMWLLRRFESIKYTTDFEYKKKSGKASQSFLLQ